jgi:hypothetical protein
MDIALLTELGRFFLARFTTDISLRWSLGLVAATCEERHPYRRFNDSTF